MAGPALPHVRQYCLQCGRDTEHIGGELITKIRHGRLFEDALQPVAGVGDGDINRAHCRLDVSHGPAHRLVIGHIQQTWVSTTRRQRLKRRGVIGLAHGSHDLVPRLYSGHGERTPQATTHSGDKERSHHLLLPVESTAYSTECQLKSA